MPRGAALAAVVCLASAYDHRVLPFGPYERVRPFAGLTCGAFHFADGCGCTTEVDGAVVAVGNSTADDLVECEACRSHEGFISFTYDSRHGVARLTNRRTVGEYIAALSQLTFVTRGLRSFAREVTVSYSLGDAWYHPSDHVYYALGPPVQNCSARSLLGVPGQPMPHPADVAALVRVPQRTCGFDPNAGGALCLEARNARGEVTLRQELLDECRGAGADATCTLYHPGTAVAVLKASVPANCSALDASFTEGCSCDTRVTEAYVTVDGGGVRALQCTACDALGLEWQRKAPPGAAGAVWAIMAKPGVPLRDMFHALASVTMVSLPGTGTKRVAWNVGQGWWAPSAGRYYAYVATRPRGARVSWFAASAACAAPENALLGLAGYLAAPATEAQQWILNARLGEGGEAWVGAAAAAGKWRWEDGAPADLELPATGFATVRGGAYQLEWTAHGGHRAVRAYVCEWNGAGALCAEAEYLRGSACFTPASYQCASCAPRGGCGAGQHCYDATSSALNDWSCFCDPPGSGSAALGRVAECAVATEAPPSSLMPLMQNMTRPMTTSPAPIPTEDSSPLGACDAPHTGLGCAHRNRVAAIMGGAEVLALVLGGGTGALGVGQLAMVRNMECFLDGGGRGPAAELDWEINPSGAALWGGATQHLLGAVVVNPILWIAFAAAQVCTAWMACFFMNSSGCPTAAELRGAMIKLAAPGAAYLPFAALLFGTTAAAVRLLWSDPTPLAIGGFAVSLNVFVSWLVSTSVLQKISSHARCLDPPPEAPAVGACRAYCCGTSQWVSARPGFVERYGLVFAAYRGEVAGGWVTAELMVAQGCGALAGLRPGTAAACSSRNACMTLLLAARLGCLVYYRPHRAPLANAAGAAFSGALCIAAAVLAGAIGTAGAKTSSAYVAVECLLVAAAWILAAKAMVDAAFSIGGWVRRRRAQPPAADDPARGGLLAPGEAATVPAKRQLSSMEAMDGGAQDDTGFRRVAPSAKLVSVRACGDAAGAAEAPPSLSWLGDGVPTMDNSSWSHGTSLGRQHGGRTPRGSKTPSAPLASDFFDAQDNDLDLLEQTTPATPQRPQGAQPWSGAPQATSPMPTTPLFGHLIMSTRSVGSFHDVPSPRTALNPLHAGPSLTGDLLSRPAKGLVPPSPSASFHLSSPSPRTPNARALRFDAAALSATTPRPRRQRGSVSSNTDPAATPTQQRKTPGASMLASVDPPRRARGSVVSNGDLPPPTPTQRHIAGKLEWDLLNHRDDAAGGEPQTPVNSMSSLKARRSFRSASPATSCGEL